MIIGRVTLKIHEKLLPVLYRLLDDPAYYIGHGSVFAFSQLIYFVVKVFWKPKSYILLTYLCHVIHPPFDVIIANNKVLVNTCF
jgi:hypothetical protein